LPQAGFISEAEHLSRDTSRDTFVPRGECAASEGRLLHAALHFRRAEFFMNLPIPRKQLLSIRVTCSAASTGRSSARRREQS
jgi:hypothetical protein